MSGRALAALTIGLLLVSVTGGVMWTRVEVAQPQDAVVDADLASRGAADHEFVVAPGTGERLADGEALDLIPNPLVVSVGETIRIRNRDRDPITLGPFYVGAHGVLTQRFVEPGRLVGDCIAHPSGRLVVRVRRDPEASERSRRPDPRATGTTEESKTRTEERAA